MKIKTVETPDGSKRYMFFCPGCKYGHHFTVPPWTFNNDFENPTISPSILTGFDNFKEKRCHSFVNGGKIRFLSDCHHELKNKTVDLPEM